MTHAEYLKEVQTALAKLDKTDHQAVRKFNEWRAELFEKIDGKGSNNAKTYSNN